MNFDGTIRAFVAVEINPVIRENVEKLQGKLRGVRDRIQWVKPANIHITVEFLGDITSEAYDDVCQSMDHIASRQNPFSCEIRGVGYFGRRQAPKVIWAGLNDSAAMLVNIQSALHLHLREKNIKVDDKPYVPHLTIARIRTHKYAGELMHTVELHKADLLGSLDVKELALIKSDLGSLGPAYTTLHRSAFSAQ